MCHLCDWLKNECIQGLMIMEFVIFIPVNFLAFVGFGERVARRSCDSCDGCFKEFTL